MEEGLRLDRPPTTHPSVGCQALPSNGLLGLKADGKETAENELLCFLHSLLKVTKGSTVLWELSM